MGGNISFINKKTIIIFSLFICIYAIAYIPQNMLFSLLPQAFSQSFKSTQDRNTQRINLVQFILENHLILSWDNNYNIGLIRKNTTIVSFQPGLPYVLINFNAQRLVDPVIKERGIFLASESFIELITQVLLNEEQYSTPIANSIAILEVPDQIPKNNELLDNNLAIETPFTKNQFSRIPTIVIDPGHGGKTPGAVGKFSFKNNTYRVMEKDIVLQVALDVKKQLAELYPNINIVMTRDKDEYVSLEDRTIIANRYLENLKDGEGMLFISIHANAALTSKASGYEVWYLPPEYRRNDLVSTDLNQSQIYNIINNIREEEITLESRQLAESIIFGLDGEIGGLSKKRGVKEEKFYVVRNAKMPAVLIELGFITNPEEGYNLIQLTYQNKLSAGIIKGIREYLKLFE